MTKEERLQPFLGFGLRRSVDEGTKQRGRDLGSRVPFVEAQFSVAFEEREQLIEGCEIEAILRQQSTDVGKMGSDAGFQEPTTRKSTV